jgi:TonB family protein
VRRVWITCAALCALPSAARAQDAPNITRPPELLEFVQADYPPAEREAGREATVTIEITIAEDGAVTDASIVESAGEAFDAAALDAVRRFRFRPAEIDGAPAAIRIHYRYEFTIEEEIETPTVATLVGIVRDRRTRAPIESVRVELADGRAAITDADGHFEIGEIAPGTIAITLSGERLTALRTEETLAAGERLEVVYGVRLRDPEEAESEDDMEIVVVAPTVRREVVSTRVQAAEARRVPGTGGDVLRVVESLPGVSRSSVGTGQLVVWGAAPEDSRVYVDGVRIPRLYHEGGLRSVVASDLVESLDLVPGGYGAAYGRGLGGIVTVRTIVPRGDGVHGSIAADLYDVSGSLRLSLDDRWRAASAARASWLHLFVEATQGDLGAFVPVPQYWDAQIRGVHEIRAGETIELAVLGAGDRVSRGVPNADPALETEERRALDFARIYARYERDGGDGTRIAIVPWIGWDQSERASRYGSIETSIGSRSFIAGLRASYAVRAADFLDLEIGLDAELAFLSLERTGSIGLPSREGDQRVFGQAPPDAIGSDDWDVAQITAAPYLQGDISLADGTLHIVPGIRLDPYARSVSRRAPREGDLPDQGLLEQSFRPEPRLSVRWDPLRELGLRAGAGLYHQYPAAEDLSASFGNPALPISQAWHVLAGVSAKPQEQLTLEATGFASFSEGLAVRNRADSPGRAQALVPEGWGRAYGVQALVRLAELEGFSGWIAYTFMRSERQDAAGLAWRPFDYDQTHVLTALVSFTPGFGFEVGARFRYATGMPRTPVVSSYYDARRDAWQPIFGERGSERLPDFVQLDVRVAQKIDLADTDLEIWLEVQNVTHQQNAEEFVYAPDYSRRDTIRGMPILPVLGLRWIF